MLGTPTVISSSSVRQATKRTSRWSARREDHQIEHPGYRVESGRFFPLPRAWRRRCVREKLCDVGGCLLSETYRTLQLLAERRHLGFMPRAQGIEVLLLVLEAGCEIGRGVGSAWRKVGRRARLLVLAMVTGWPKRRRRRGGDGEDVLRAVLRPLRLVAAVFLAPVLAAGPALGRARALERTVEAVGVEPGGGLLAAQPLLRKS